MELIEREKIQWFGCDYESDKNCKDANGVCNNCFFATCNHDQVMNIPTVPAIPIDRIKQLREEMENNCRGVILNGTIDRAMKLDDVLELIDNMIKEYEK